MAAELNLRPAQEKILRYKGGRLGVSAVPGSGKTYTLSRLAAKLVQKLASSGPMDDREVLVVTLTNAAVENFRARINQFIQSGRLLPGGFRVRTLHSLAHDIVRERPGLVGLGEDFSIVDERSGQEIKRQAVNGYLQAHPDVLGGLIDPEYLSNPRRIERHLPETAQEVAEAVIRRAKDLRTDAVTLDNALKQQSGTWPLLSFGLQIYRDYQRGLSVRGGIDFDDLILLALQALEADGNYLSRLQSRWPYVLEDEAQDSSALQEDMLKLLTAAHGNWVRVGDPNQAIHTTFTSADPKYLRQFVLKEDVCSLPLPDSGRSAPPIIKLANQFIDWSREEHPVLPEAKALSLPHIEPTGEGDPQPNPEPGVPDVFFFERALTPAEEIQTLVVSLGRWLPKNTHKTVAVLVPDNRRGADFARAFEEASLPYDDSLLQSTSTTRVAVDALVKVLRYISQPHNSTHLPAFWSDVWWPRRGQHHCQASFGVGNCDDGVEPAAPPWLDATTDSAGSASEIELPQPVSVFGKALGQMRQPEQFIFPAAGDDWLDGIGWIDEYEGFRSVVELFRTEVQRWCAATILPIDELILTLGQGLFTEAAELGLAHSVAILLAKRVRERPELRLPELTKELEEIARNRRRILGFNEDAHGFEPLPGKVTIATMHTAKGLEWDRVHLASVSNYSFPSGGDEDSYRGERWFVRDSLNLTAEAIAQTEQLHMGTLDEYVPGQASLDARQEVAAERLRLLYVGITRARQELILTYNTGSRHETSPNAPALAFEALRSWWESGRHDEKGKRS